MSKRTQCILSGSKNLEDLHQFTDFPVFMGCLDIGIDQEKHLIADMNWQICQDTGMIQLKNLIDLETLYPESHGSGLVGSLWNSHHSEFARFIKEVSPSDILEIGGAHGILCDKYHQLTDTTWTIVEPNPTPTRQCKARIVKGFFDSSYVHPKPIDTVVHSHVLEHVYEPNNFMSHLSSLIPKDCNLIFSVPNMGEMLKRRYTNVLNFEHTYLLDERTVEYLLSTHNFKIARKKYFLEDHSIFYHAIKTDTELASVDTSMDRSRIENLYEINKILFQAYIKNHSDEVNQLNQIMSETENPIFLFGAHVFSQYLISGFGLQTQKIKYILDNDHNKHGKVLSGTSLQVRSPKELVGHKTPIVILRAGVYNEEIKEDILSNINNDTIFI